jgi:beta-RFAP synthase
MSSTVQITTGSRLHFGPLAVGATAGRAFGGIGLMIEQPRLVLRATESERDRIEADPDSREVIARTLTAVRARLGTLAPAGLAIELAESIPRHFGLGSGTQLALAAAQAVLGSRVTPAVPLADASGRGARSAIGVHGYESGGFLVDAGKRDAARLGTLATQVSFPSDWPILLWMPDVPAGLSGEAERTAFARMAPMSESLTDRLCGLVVREMLPAIADRHWGEFSDGLRRYGDLVGAHFAAIQGGIWADSACADVAAWLSDRGIRGVAQSSWGPTLAAILPDVATAARLRSDWPFPAGRLVITRAKNRGAEVLTLTPNPGRTTPAGR